MMNRMVSVIAAAAWLFQLHSAAAAGAAFTIVPGQRAGAVALGMTPAAAAHALGPPTRVRRLPAGVILETWIDHRPLPFRESAIRLAKQLKSDYVSVFFQAGRAIQIEVSAAAFTAPGGLNTDRKVSLFEKAFHPYSMFQCTWKATDPGGASPACKHLLWYGDDISAGIAWKQGGWGCLAPEPHPQPEALIVHRRGVRTLVNPNDADDYSGTGGRGRKPGRGGAQR
ncbi:MAG: hypothetical protein LC772_02860, partial [Chloroflexi bacterium]|nr:hypothetical protein [Chloroflexota bacterium]